MSQPNATLLLDDLLKERKQVTQLRAEVDRYREVLRQVEQDIDAVPEYQLNPRTEEEVRSALAVGGDPE